MLNSPPRKRPRRPHITHERIELEDDYEVLQARTSSLRSGGFAVDNGRSPLRNAAWTVGKSWAPDDDPELDLDQDNGWYDEEMDADIGYSLDNPIIATKGPVPKKRRSEASARPHVFWKRNFRQTYLEEFMRAEGRGDFIHATECPDCVSRRTDPPNTPEFRCLDCFLPELTCKLCCIRRHQLNPLHIIEKWTGSSFVKISLKDVGLVIHLNHASLRCPLPAPVVNRFRILHTNGIHEVGLSYCACQKEIPHHLQLLRRGLYPASQRLVRTAVSFPLLRLIHLLALASKISSYDIYRALERLTMNSNVSPPKPRYRPLMRVLTQWRHLKLLKRGGRGYQKQGAERTSNGELAIPCPSCPRPDVNLDSDWLLAPGTSAFLYQSNLSMDANFRLKNNLVSNYSTDPGLGIGWAYMIPRADYEAYVLSQADEEDISTCVGFQALAKATTRNSKGLRYTGVGAVSCARSEMIMPTGVGNLQKGERYANMDYIFAYVVSVTYVMRIGISYDIVCQWFINIFVRMRQWPGNLRLRPGLFLRPLIPKFHEPAHTDKDHEQYSFNLADGVGLTDGEAPERIWGPNNALANSTKSMGPGTMHDVYDDNFGFWNWTKYTGMGVSLLRRFKDAVGERNKQVEAHRGFTDSLPVDLIGQWEEMCMLWSEDSFPKTAESPFKTSLANVTEIEARNALDREEEEERHERGMPALHNTSAASFLALGLELEESQRRMHVLVAELSAIPTNLQTTALEDQRGVLREKIKNWELIRAIYMPGLLQYLTDAGESPAATWESNPDPEGLHLWLPSDIPSEHRRRVCVEGLPGKELKLRVAQCSSSLESVRHVLRLKTRMVYFKNKNIRGQREGTRSRAVIDRIHKRALRYVQKYRFARAARLNLEGPGEWEGVFRELHNADVRSYTSGAKKVGPGRRGIWEDGHAPDVANADDVMMGSSDDELATVGEQGVPLTREQALKARKAGTGESRKELSWIWQTFTMSTDDGDNSNDILRSEWARSRARSLRAKEEVELITEEMRRVLATLTWKADWWGKLKLTPFAATSGIELREGLLSYAEDQETLQLSLAASFRQLWRTPLQDVDRIVQDLSPPGAAREGAAGDDGEAEADDGNDSDDSNDSDNDSEPSSRPPNARDVF